MILLAATLAAVTIGYVLYHVIPIPASYWVGRLDHAFSEGDIEEMPAWKAFLLILSEPLGKYAPAKLLNDLGSKLHWAQLHGYWLGWEKLTFLALCVAAGLGGFIGGMALINTTLGAVICAGVGFYVPIVLVGGKANKSIREARQQLPEFTQLLATEVATGSSLEVAIENISKGESALSRWFREVLRASRGRILFSVRGEGVLRQRAEASGLKEMYALAVQLDNLYEQGVGGKELLSALAMSAASEYLAEVDRQAESLPTRLVMPSVVFFFIPFTIAVIAPFAISLFETFGGGV